MNLKQAQEILKPYDIIIMFDDALRMYKVFLGASIVYITQEDMKLYDEPDFKTAIAHSLVRDSVVNEKITLN